ncbi:vanadium-dependent haloperoxidase [Chitinophaga pendula]|uniref:vanadium-dependent haloperoxidase n=1 Tax=Chitinophaga TaxID=79328 RepID=UPI000BAF0371|nr:MULTISPECIES: vanadium-dependent haloperoxidase [Chitinophaga]ASZ11908.1 PA-phosphatase [Chitinophaga sp. MD30]UCJ05064.1 vanadium-dependent haloperoxidase [Chitinophaga pendula]
MQPNYLRNGLCCLLLLCIFACRKEQQIKDDQRAPITESLARIGETAIPASWYQLQLKLIKETPGFSPPVAARAIAYTGVAGYEAVAPGIQGYPSLNGQLNGLSQLPRPDRFKRYKWSIAANSALAAITKNLYPNASPANVTAINQLETDNLAALSNNCDSAEVSRSVNFGKQIAAAILQWSNTDGGKDGYANNFPTDYIPPVGPGLWVPTPPQFQRALLPYWGNNRPLVRPATPDVPNIPHPPYATDTTSAFYKAAWLVYHKGITLTPEERTIALYWADGGGTFTPPGHLIAIAVQLAGEQQLSLARTARLLAQVGISLNDAGILCWKYKYKYNLVRPVTYIKNQIDSAWNPLINTPPFPSYTSGHATFTSAAGNVLAGNFGNNFTFSDKQKIPDGFSARSFNTFSAMIDEAAISRVYGGIHYEYDSEAGKTTGKQIANRVLSLRF